MSVNKVLDMSAMQDDFFSDTSMIGISTVLAGHRFCWLLNKQLGIDFVREPELDICLQINPEEKRYFPVYQYLLPLNGGRYVLYKLKTDKESFLPEIKQLDYLMLLQSLSPEEDAEYILQLMRDLPDIQLAQLLARNKLKNANYLLL